MSYHWYLSCKTAADITLALVLVILAAPLVALAALVVKLTSRGPAFYTQTRVGRNGRLFTIYKIRTMVDKCESLTGPRWAIPGDPRITPVGQFLRLSHLDELPQLLNVLRGQMGLIGPRPERPEFVPELERALPLYHHRLVLRPGVTGLAQVHLPGDTDVDSVRRKLAYDLYYIEQLSPWLDLRILFCTVLYAVGIPFRISRKLVRMPSVETVERAMQAATSRAAAPAPQEGRLTTHDEATRTVESPSF
jgi:lipopolysaccharide/colanic/teichoic acid biosynthesis glycosyltransferase